MKTYILTPEQARGLVEAAGRSPICYRGIDLSYINQAAYVGHPIYYIVDGRRAYIAYKFLRDQENHSRINVFSAAARRYLNENGIQEVQDEH